MYMYIIYGISSKLFCQKNGKNVLTLNKYTKMKKQHRNRKKYHTYNRNELYLNE